MNVDVLWCSLHDEILARGYADQGFLEEVLAGQVWRPQDPIQFDHHEIRNPNASMIEFLYDGAIVIFNGRTHADPVSVAWITEIVRQLPWAVTLICGDEEWDFPWREIPHDERHKVWVMQARPEHGALDGFLPGGWYPNTHDMLRPDFTHRAGPRSLDWFFGGQVTHERRRQCVKALRNLPDGRLVETSRYLEEGIPRQEYFQTMVDAKVIPCPSGPYSVDCARAFEALEAGCVPMLDTVPACGPAFDYWTLLFGAGHPVPTIADWTTFPHRLRREVKAWPANANRIFAWWQGWKRDHVRKLHCQIREVAGSPRTSERPDDVITVVVTTSPTPVHPSTEHIEQVIASVRAQLPLAEIIIAIDGIRAEQEHLREAYQEYVRRVLWLCNYEWPNTVPLLLPEWAHQAGAARAALELVHTPLMLFVEHDTPLVGTIDWPTLAAFILSGEANLVRFHQDYDIHPDHERVMLDHENRVQVVGGELLTVRRTVAWWQRPHLASARFYRERVLPLIGADARTMIEEVLYAVVNVAYEDRGEAAWWDWRLWVYTPWDDEYGMRRSGHLDSRGDEPKYPMRYAYTGPPPPGAPEPGIR